MRILALSDLHFGKQKAGWETYAEDRVAAAVKAAKKFKPEVFYFGGDLADHGPDEDKLVHFRRGLEALDTIPVDNRVMVCGNHDLEFLEGDSVFEYADILQEAVSKYGFHLLDKAPYVHSSGVAFVGNIGLHDGSFWTKPPVVDPNWPSTKDAVRLADEAHWDQIMGGFNKPATSQTFHEECKVRFCQHFDAQTANQIILCTHHTPAPQFVVGGSAKFEFLNWYMGFNGETLHPYFSHRAILGLCGHTHRDHMAQVGTTWVRNVSGPNQPSIIDTPQPSILDPLR